MNGVYMECTDTELGVRIYAENNSMKFHNGGLKCVHIESVSGVKLGVEPSVFSQLREAALCFWLIPIRLDSEY